MRLLMLTTFGALAGVTSICGAIDAMPPVTASAQSVSRIQLDKIVSSALDPSVDACSNFYQHACGGFITSTKLTDETPSINMSGRAFDTNLDHSLRALFAEKISNDPELARLKTFYGSCLDNDLAKDDAVVKQWLDRIDAARSVQDEQRLLRALNAIGVDPFFTYSGQADPARWARYRGEIDGTYLWAKRTVVAKAFTDAGAEREDADRDAGSVMEMVAALNAKRGDRYDAKTAEHPQSLAQLEQLAPAIDWPSFFDMVGAPRGRAINVVSLDHLRAVQQLLATSPPAKMHAFLRWTFLFSLRGELPTPYNQAFGDIPPGFRIKLEDPSGRCRDATVRAMGVEFSRQYAQHILGWKARQTAIDISLDIKKAIVNSVAQDHWLSASARKATAAKLAKTDLKIGFPDHWPEVGNYPLEKRHFLANVLAARRFEQQRIWRRAQRPRLRGEWEMTVSPWVGDGMAAARLVVPNGFPDAFSNSLIMTAAFLAPPRFDRAAPPEYNYGTFGAVFAHEFVHVAESHMFAADGRNAELWSAADGKSAKVRDHCVIEQADAYSPLPGVKMSGDDQFDENVADYGGVRLAFEALQAKLGPRIYHRDVGGTSPAQRFFYKYAQNYCTAQTDASLRSLIAGDSHAPPSFRVNGPLSNLPAFAKAFACTPGAPMARTSEQRCRVW